MQWNQIMNLNYENTVNIHTWAMSKTWNKNGFIYRSLLSKTPNIM